MRGRKAGAGLLLALAAVIAAPSASAQQAVPVPLDHLPALKGDYFRWSSPAVGRDYHIYVRLPQGYAEAPERHYPVVYLLDGDSLFPLLAASHLLLTIDEKLPEAIVVGIAYGSFEPAVNRRSIDFMSAAPGVPAAEAGASAFHRFLKAELLPEIERRYRADPARRILVGQSRGGSFVLYSAFTDPDLFWGRIASNPSFGRDGERYFGPASAGSRRDLHLIVASGSRDVPQLREDALRWSRAWQGRRDAPWAVRFVTIEGGTHAASIPAVYRAGMLRLFGPDAER
jgi:uncharacterized protein